jgi:hypothetical protein
MTRKYSELTGMDRAQADRWAYIVADNYRDFAKENHFANWHLEMFRRYIHKSLPLCGLECIERELTWYLGDKAAPALELARKVAAEVQATPTAAATPEPAMPEATAQEAAPLATAS